MQSKAPSQGQVAHTVGPAVTVHHLPPRLRPVVASTRLERFGQSRRHMLREWLALVESGDVSADDLREEVRSTTGAMLGITVMVEVEHG